MDETVVPDPSPAGAQPHNAPAAPSLHPSQSPTANTNTPPVVTTAPSQPPLAQTEPVRPLLNEELFRMVQVGTSAERIETLGFERAFFVFFSLN